MFLKIRELAFSFGNKELLNGLNLELKKGSKIAIARENGSGKSTFLDILAGVKEPTSGEIEKSLNLKIGYFLQNSNDWFLAPTVLDDVVFTPLINGVCKEDAKERAHLLLAKFQVSHLESCSIRQLSGGEKRL